MQTKGFTMNEQTETARVEPGVSQQFDVWIICTRGTGHAWRKMATCDDRWQADQLVAYHKMIDEKVPKGHYRYKVEPVTG